MKKKSLLTCWIITEGLAGTENQCLAIADSLSLKPKVVKLELRQPWKVLTPWLFIEHSLAFRPKLQSPWPDLIISSGRKAIAAARFIKKKSHGKTFSVFIQDPRSSLDAFDLVAVPAHDPSRGENIIVTNVAPNRVTNNKLEQAKEDFAAFKKLPGPRVAVLIGGKSKAYDFSSSTIESLIFHLQALLDKDFSLMMTTSRRTGEGNAKKLKQAFFENERVSFWDGEVENPYMGYLAYADFILVTADSVSMISDALSTGKPTYVIPMEGGGKRLAKFHENLISKKLVRWFDGDLEAYSYEPICEAERIASVIRNKLQIIDE